MFSIFFLATISVLNSENIIPMDSETFIVDNVTYTIISESEVAIGDGENCAYSGPEISDIIIPNEIEHQNSTKYNVTAIYKNGFSGIKLVGKLVLPSSITTIGDYAFNYANISTHFDLPENITSIGNIAFKKASIPDFTVNLSMSDITVIKDSTFEDMSTLIKIILPPNLETINELAFSGTSISSIEFPETLTEIKQLAFKNSQLKYIELPSSLQSIGYGSFSGCVLRGNFCLPINLTTIGEKAFDSAYFLGPLNIPDKLTSLENVFGPKCVMTSLHIGSSLTRLSINEINNEFLEEITVSEENQKFNYTNGFLALNDEAIIAPRNVTNVNLDGIKTVRSYAFAYCRNISNFEIPLLSSVGDYAFYKSSAIGNLNLSEATIGVASFAFTEIKGNLTLPKKLTESAFESSYVSGELVLDDTYKTIPNNVFKKCRLSGQLVLPESLEYIGDLAFYECPFSGTVTIPSSVTHIGAGAFGCTNISLFESSSHRFPVVNGTLLYLHLDEKEMSIFATPPQLQMDYYPLNATSIDSYAFSGYQFQISRIPDYITKLGSFAFERSKVAGDIYLHKNLHIESTTFVECYGITAFTADMYSEYYISRGPIVYDTSLSTVICVASGSTVSISFEKNAQIIRPFAFYRSSIKSNIQIPESVIEIGESAFEEANATFSNADLSNVVTIGARAFASVPGATISALPTADILSESAFEGTKVTDSVKIRAAQIGTRSLALSGVSTAFLLDQVSEIGSQAFYGSSSINVVVCHDIKVAADAFRDCSGTANVTDAFIGNVFGGLNVSVGDCSIVEEEPRRTPYPSATPLPLPEFLSKESAGWIAIGLGVGGAVLAAAVMIVVYTRGMKCLCDRSIEDSMELQSTSAYLV